METCDEAGRTAMAQDEATAQDAQPDPRRLVPRTDAVLADPRLVLAQERLGRAIVKEAISRAQDEARAGRIAPGSVADAAVAGLPARPATLNPVINATGVLL
ncbi:MAG: hypothetical protein ACRDNF_04555, partial [Streptosporangiaceae bacterium]